MIKKKSPRMNRAGALEKTKGGLLEKLPTVLIVSN
jgi:hypothetical protein